MSSLLIAEEPLQFLPTLARRIGLSEAIVLQQIHNLAWSSSNGWVQMTYDDWVQLLAFPSVKTLERTFKNLRVQGLVIAELVPGGSGRRYRVDYDVLDTLPPDTGCHGL